ncbi:winged helix-turn-helix domain-containing protein [Shewanella olleyana]
MDCAATPKRGGGLTAEDVQKFILNEFGVSYCHSPIYWLLHKLGFS